MYDILHAELLNVSECAREVVESRTRLTPDQRALRDAIKRLDAVYRDLGRKMTLGKSAKADEYEIVLENEQEMGDPELFGFEEPSPLITSGRRVLDLR
jgi:hypothetical protein